MIEMFKILTDKYDPEVTDFIRMNPGTSTRGHSKKIYKTRTRLDVRKYSFVHRSVDIWNNLPSSVVSAKTVKSFEARLDRHWQEQPLYYNYSESIKNTQPGLDHNLSSEDCLELAAEDSEESYSQKRTM